MTTTDSDLESDIQKTAKTVFGLMKTSKNAWVSWDQVSKDQTGSTEDASRLCSLASLPEWKLLFATRGNVVKLTADGIIYVQNLPPDTPTLTGMIANAVIQYAAGLKPICLKGDHVSTVATVGNRVVQAVHIDLIDEVLPSETPLKIYSKNSSSSDGKIVGQEPDGGVLYVALSSEILPADLPITLLIDRAYLLTQLAKQLHALASMPERMSALFDKHVGVSLIAHDDSKVVAGQLAKLPPPWTRFLWGPPGAGKTYGLGHFVAQLLRAEPESRILIVAPSNRAVDVAIEHLATRLEVNSMERLILQRKLLRFGYPRKTSVIEKPDLLGPPHLDALNKGVQALSRQIAKAEHDRVSDADLAVLRTELLAAQEAVKDAVHQHVQECSVVATTTTLAYMPGSPIPKTDWDTVIVDEVTMVPFAMCTFLASLAKRRFLLAGDPRQLGPVYEQQAGQNGNTYSWLGCDMFEMGGVSTGVKEQRQIKTDDPRLTRITCQRRCAPDIWNRVKGLYPEVNNVADPRRLAAIIEMPPSPGKSVVLLDTSGTAAKCECRRGSWHNRFTAELAMEVASTICSEAMGSISVAIICPYRAQVRLLRRWIREERRATTTPFQTVDIEAGTVHQFQGSDADVVIFDLVDGEGRSDLGKLLRDDTGMRLVNVAITRAKGKLIVIADKDWCKRSNMHFSNGLLKDLILGPQTGNIMQVVPSAEEPENNDGTESPIEKALLQAIKEHAALASVETQHVIRDEKGHPVSRADFAFPELKYAVYCDGKQWHCRADRWERDWRQRNKLTELGWVFSVFTGRDINKDAGACAVQVFKTFQSRSSE